LAISLADIYDKYILHCVSQGRIVSIVTRPHNRGIVVPFLVGSRDFSVHQSVEISPGAHPPSYLMGTRDSFPGSKAVAVTQLAPYIYLLSRLRVPGVIPPLSLMA